MQVSSYCTLGLENTVVSTFSNLPTFHCAFSLHPADVSQETLDSTISLTFKGTRKKRAEFKLLYPSKKINFKLKEYKQNHPELFWQLQDVWTRSTFKIWKYGFIKGNGHLSLEGHWKLSLREGSQNDCSYKHVKLLCGKDVRFHIKFYLELGLIDLFFNMKDITHCSRTQRHARVALVQQLKI